MSSYKYALLDVILPDKGRYVTNLPDVLYMCHWTHNPPHTVSHANTFSNTTTALSQAFPSSWFLIHPLSYCLQKKKPQIGSKIRTKPGCQFVEHVQLFDHLVWHLIEYSNCYVHEITFAEHDFDFIRSSLLYKRYNQLQNDISIERDKKYDYDTVERYTTPTPSSNTT